MGSSPYHLSGPVRSEPTEYPDETVVNVEPVLAADEGLAFLFDPDAGLLLVPDHEVMDFEHGLVKEAHGFLDGLLVDLDDQAAQELVEMIFQAVLFGLSDFNGELHRVLLSTERYPQQAHGLCHSTNSGKFVELAILFARGVSIQISAVPADVPVLGGSNLGKLHCGYPAIARVPSASPRHSSGADRPCRCTDTLADRPEPAASGRRARRDRCGLARLCWVDRQNEWRAAEPGFRDCQDRPRPPRAGVLRVRNRAPGAGTGQPGGLAAAGSQTGAGSSQRTV